MAGDKVRISSLVKETLEPVAKSLGQAPDGPPPGPLLKEKRKFSLALKGSLRPFDGVYPFDSLRAGSDEGRAQDRLGAKNFAEVVLLNILSVRIYVDTGAFVSIFTLNEAAGLGLNYHKGKETFVTVGDGGLIPVYLHRLPVQIGPIVFNASIGFSPRLGVGFNLLGRQDIFTCFDVTFRDAKKLVTFRPISLREPRGQR